MPYRFKDVFLAIWDASRRLPKIFNNSSLQIAKLHYFDCRKTHYFHEKKNK